MQRQEGKKECAFVHNSLSDIDIKICGTFSDLPCRLFNVLTTFLEHSKGGRQWGRVGIEAGGIITITVEVRGDLVVVLVVGGAFATTDHILLHFFHHRWLAEGGGMEGGGMEDGDIIMEGGGITILLL